MSSSPAPLELVLLKGSGLDGTYDAAFAPLHSALLVGHVSTARVITTSYFLRNEYGLPRGVHGELVIHRIVLFHFTNTVCAWDCDKGIIKGCIRGIAFFQTAPKPRIGALYKSPLEPPDAKLIFLMYFCSE